MIDWTWVIQANMLPQATGPLVEVLQDEKVPYVGVELEPFGDDISWLCGEAPQHTRLLPYGSTKLVRLAYEKGWEGVCYRPEEFSVSRWNSCRDDMLNGDASIVRAGALHKRLQGARPDDLWFIRPDHDLKYFNGTLTTVEKIRNWLDDPGGMAHVKFGEDTLCAISPPKKIEMESRWFIVGGKVVTGSVYRMHGQQLTQRVTDPWLIQNAEEAARKWLPMLDCTMDLAVMEKAEGKVVRVVEFNCLNSSGFYNHDLRALVRAICGRQCGELQ